MLAQQGFRFRIGTLDELETNHRLKTSFADGLLDLLERACRLLVISLHFNFAREPDERHLAELHSPVELMKVRADDLVKPDKQNVTWIGIRMQLDPLVQIGRHLDTPKGSLRGFRIFHREDQGIRKVREKWEILASVKHQG